MALLGRWRLKQCMVGIVLITLGCILFLQWDLLKVKYSHRNATGKKEEVSLLVIEEEMADTAARLFSDANFNKNSSSGDGIKPEKSDVPPPSPRRDKQRSKTFSTAKGYGVLDLFSRRPPQQGQQYCGGSVEIFNRVQVVLRNVTLDPTRGYAKATGGVDPAAILKKQTEQDEEYRLTEGFFTVPCPPPLSSNNNQLQVESWTWSGALGSGLAKHLKDYTKSVVFDSSGHKNGGDKTATENRFTVALMRYEYANVYWTVMDLYDVFLITRFFNETPGDTRILFTDARPRGHLDALWDVFGLAAMLQEIKAKTTFRKLAWRYGREHSPLLQKSAQTLPELAAFRQFMLRNLGIIIPADGKEAKRLRDCNRLNVLYIWRRDYVAHPRNPSGLVWRKIRNEEELIRATSARFPTFRVRGVQLDKLTVTEQLRLISGADVYVGMHGAAMTFSLFLPPNSAVIELYPRYYKVPNWHMEMAAKWGGHRYYRWHNKDSRLEEEETKYTTVPTEVPIDFIEEARGHMCT